VQNEKWRLSFVSEIRVLNDEGEAVNQETYAKRYTFLLGEGEKIRTASERLLLLIGKKLKLDDIKMAFSVEKMSKAFFDEYKDHYLNFVEFFTGKRMVKKGKEWVETVIGEPNPQLIFIFKSNEKDTRDFCKKLLGRIVFLYFVQKKGWLGASNKDYTDGTHNFIMDLFIKSGKNDTFYPVWLSTLFFDTLNQGRPEDDFKMPDGGTVKIPFLNGGLFDKDKYDLENITLKSLLFHNPANEEDPRLRGFFDFLNSYNFTIYEDSPEEQTVAVDPEMLSHIFENLLEDNKDKGAFYTPKEIVHNMCQESLIEYLSTHLSKEFTVYKPLGSDQIELFGNETQTGQLTLIETIGEQALNRNDVENIVRKKDFIDLTEKQLKRINELLDSVKICDPAIGSGAFPMGLLKEIFNIKELIAYMTDSEWNPSEVKLNIIQNSIYGVDIEKGAVDIARLRFWLSLIVDEEKPKPLPNLDYKIVVGDSLVSKFDDHVVEINWKKDGKVGIAKELLEKINELLKQVTKEQKKYFNAPKADKQKISIKIKNLKLDLLLNQITLNKKQYEDSTEIKGGFMPSDKDRKHNCERSLKISEFDNLISKLQILKKNPDMPFNHFDWKLDFPELLNPYLVENKDLLGFDIVIGNPPYVQLQKESGRLAEMYKGCGYKTFERTGDIYALFYEAGINVLKENGNLCFITSNKWMRAGYGKSLRNLFISQNPIILIDLGPDIFEQATVDTNILIIKKSKNSKKLKAATLKKTKNSSLDIADYFNRNSVELSNLSVESWFIGNNAEQKLKEKIEKNGTPLKELEVKINFGIKIGFNEAFIIDTAIKEKLCEEDPKSAEIIKPILRGRDIKRYSYEWDGLWLLATGYDINVPKKYPAVYKHLLKFVDGAKNRYDQGVNWWNLRACKYYKDFEEEKIIWKRIGSVLRFAYDKSGTITQDSTCIMTGNKLKYICAFLNSRIGFKQIFDNAPKTGTGDVIVSVQAIEPLKIPKITSGNIITVSEIESLVSTIMLKKEKNQSTLDEEKQIDKLVYKLYELTDEEIRIVEGENGGNDEK
jgi:hypothetical protein